MISEKHPAAEEIIDAIVKYLDAHAPAGEIDYIQIVAPDTLEVVQKTQNPVQILIAVKFPGARLIDNMRVG